MYSSLPSRQRQITQNTPPTGIKEARNIIHKNKNQKGSARTVNFFANVIIRITDSIEGESHQTLSMALEMDCWPYCNVSCGGVWIQESTEWTSGGSGI